MVSSNEGNCIYVDDGTAEYNRIYCKIENGSLSGYVNDTFFNPIKGAVISIKCGGLHMQNTSDSNGFYYIGNVPIVDCYWNVSASKKRYETYWIEMSIDINSTYDFVLTPLGKTLYVGGNETGNYTTIQSAVDNASDGDTVFVYSGTYYENVGIVKKTVSLVGQERDTTIIDAQKKRCALSVNNSQKVEIKGFTFQQGQFGIEIWLCNNNIISDNKISNNGCGISISGSDNNIIADNVVNYNSGHGININSIFGKISSDKNDIFSNLIKENQVGVFVTVSSDNNINRNNFYNNSRDAFFDFSQSTNWNENYWNRPRVFPKPIFGYIILMIPWVEFDWHPAKEPYYIT